MPFYPWPALGCKLKTHIFLLIFAFSSFFHFLAWKTLKRQILTSLWSVQHSNSCKNILVNWKVACWQHYTNWIWVIIKTKRKDYSIILLAKGSLVVEWSTNETWDWAVSSSNATFNKIFFQIFYISAQCWHQNPPSGFNPLKPIWASITSKTDSTS